MSEESAVTTNMSAESPNEVLLSCFSPTVSLGHRAALLRPYRTIRGEGTAELTPIPTASGGNRSVDSFVSGGRCMRSSHAPSQLHTLIELTLRCIRYMGLHSFETEGILGEGNYSQVQLV